MPTPSARQPLFETFEAKKGLFSESRSLTKFDSTRFRGTPKMFGALF